MGTWFCPGHPTWDCQEFDVSGGYSNIKECCDYCNNCQHSTGTSTWQCDSLTNKCSLQTGSDGFSSKLLCDRVCGGITGDISECSSNQYLLFGKCIDKNYIYAFGIGLIGLYYLKQKGKI